MGVTGQRASLASQAGEMGRRLKAVTDKPVLLGIGISNAEQAVEAAQFGDGVIIGSALMARLLNGGGPDAAHEFVSELRAALDRA
jgi:tryptophan synthase alpha chain